MISSSKTKRVDKLIDFNSLKHYAKKSLNEIIYEDLKGRILKGDIPFHERLQEDKLTANYGTSRTPIRDALRRLEQENIIEKLHYGGYKVKELTIKDIEEIFGIRCVLESYAASLATQRIRKVDIREMEKILAKSCKALEDDDFETFVELNTEFHEYLYAASQSEHLLRILRNQWDYFYRYRKIILKTKRNLEDSVRDHGMMIEKMKDGDTQAVERLVKEHVQRALSALRKELKQGG